MANKIVIYNSYDFKNKGAYLKLSSTYQDATHQWKLDFINEVIKELEKEKNYLTNNLNIS
jgi:hypothetical protein